MIIIKNDTNQLSVRKHAQSSIEEIHMKLTKNAKLFTHILHLSSNGVK